MAAIVGTSPKNLGKMGKFTCDMSSTMTNMPTELGRPFYKASHAVSFR